MARTYSVEEANRILQEVRPLVAGIAQLVLLLPELQEQVRERDYLHRRPGADDASQQAYLEAQTSLEGAESELMKALQELDLRGILLKDAGQGLIDFPSYREGEPVELCWKLGEEAVLHWHRIGEGFAGRRRL